MERKDSWMPEDDFILAECVLKHITNGSTQLKAFEEAADVLGRRTSSACGFRWNSVVRKNYEKQIEEAKQIRKGLVTVSDSTNQVEIAEDYFKDKSENPFEELIETFKILAQEYNDMKQTITNLQARNQELENKLASKPDSEDLTRNLIEILNKAREMGFLNSTQNKPAI